MILIDCLFRNISNRLSSHWAAWPYLRRAQWEKILGDFSIEVNSMAEPSYNNIDELWLYHGMDWKQDAKVLGITGGLNRDIIRSFERFVEFNGKVRSIDVEMPDFGELILARSDWEEFTTINFLEKLSKKCLEIRKSSDVVLDPAFETLVIGDSHAISVAHNEAMCSRNDFKTLNGVLTSESLIRFISSFLEKDKDRGLPKHLVTYFGNIDVRHHFCRLYPDWTYRKEELDRICLEYVSQLHKIKEAWGTSVTIVAPLPIENEARVLPKTGYYKGQPFWGSWVEREDTRNYMTDVLQELAEQLEMKVYTHPSNYLNNLGELSFEVMEKPRSVHMSREFYAFDLETGTINSRNAWKNIKIPMSLKGKIQ